MTGKSPKPCRVDRFSAACCGGYTDDTSAILSGVRLGLSVGKSASMGTATRRKVYRTPVARCRKPGEQTKREDAANRKRVQPATASPRVQAPLEPGWGTWLYNIRPGKVV